MQDQALLKGDEDNAVECIENMKQVVELGRLIREQNNIPVKKPVLKMTIINSNPSFLKGLSKFESYLTEEVNCLEIAVEANEDAFVSYKVDWDKKALGQRLKKDFAKVEPQLSTLTSDRIKEYIANGKITIEGIDVLEGELKPSRHFHEQYQNHENLKTAADKEFAVLIDSTMTKEIAQGYYSREYLNKIQKLRKDNKLELDADIEIFYQADTPELKEAIEVHYAVMKEKLKKRFINAS